MRVVELVRASLAPQLHHRLHDLIHARRAHGVPAGLEPAHGVDGQAAISGQRARRGQFQGLAPGCEAAGLQRHRGHDAERIVQLEEVNIVGREARERVSLMAGDVRGFQP